MVASDGMKPTAAKPPFRADQVGSLLRPRELAEARAKWKKGALDARALRGIEDRAVREAVARQESAGLEAVTDGEFRRDYRQSRCPSSGLLQSRNALMSVWSPEMPTIR